MIQYNIIRLHTRFHNPIKKIYIKYIYLLYVFIVHCFRRVIFKKKKKKLTRVKYNKCPKNNLKRIRIRRVPTLYMWEGGPRVLDSPQNHKKLIIFILKFKAIRFCTKKIVKYKYFLKSPVLIFINKYFIKSVSI